MLYIRIDIHHLCLASIVKFGDGRTLRKTLKRWWGRLEWRVATKSGGDETGDETGDSRTRPATRRRRRLVTNEKAATGGVKYTDEGECELTSAIFVW